MYSLNWSGGIGSRGFMSLDVVWPWWRCCYLPPWSCCFKGYLSRSVQSTSIPPTVNNLFSSAVASIGSTAVLCVFLPPYSVPTCPLQLLLSRRPHAPPTATKRHHRHHQITSSSRLRPALAVFLFLSIFWSSASSVWEQVFGAAQFRFNPHSADLLSWQPSYDSRRLWCEPEGPLSSGYQCSTPRHETSERRPAPVPAQFLLNRR